MAHDLVFLLDAVAAMHVAGSRAISSALPQLLRLTIEIISGAASASSISLPTRRLACRPRVISVSMSASFIW